MSSGVIFVPGAFGITLKRPKRRTLQSPMKACGVTNCKQLYNPDNPVNKIFYGTANCGKLPRRDHCPMHASMAMEDKEVEAAAQKNPFSASSLFTRKPSRDSISASSIAASSMSANSVFAGSSLARSVSTNSSSASLVTQRPENGLRKDREAPKEGDSWRERPAASTFGFGNIEEDLDA